jgi:cold shock CspA family protein
LEVSSQSKDLNTPAPENIGIEITHHTGIIENFVIKDGVAKFGFILYDSQRIFFHLKEGKGELFDKQPVTFDAIKDPNCTKLKAVNVRSRASQMIQGRVTFYDQRLCRGFIQPLDPSYNRIAFASKSLVGNGIQCPKNANNSDGSDTVVESIAEAIPLELGCVVEFEVVFVGHRTFAVRVRVLEKSNQTAEEQSVDVHKSDLSGHMDRYMERSRPPPVTTTRRRHSRSDNSPESAPVDTSGINWRPQPQPRRHSWRDTTSSGGSNGSEARRYEGAARRPEGAWRRGSKTGAEGGTDNGSTRGSSGSSPQSAGRETRYAKGPGSSPGFQLARTTRAKAPSPKTNRAALDALRALQ